MSEKIQFLSGSLKGHELELDGTPITFGSHASSLVNLEGKEIAEYHAVLEKSNGRWILKSKTTDYFIVSEERQLTELHLEHDTTFQIGKYSLRYSCDRTSIDGSSYSGKAIEDPEAAAKTMQEAKHRIMEEIGKAVIGQHSVIQQMLVALFAKGHCLLVGTPGLAKTTMAKTLAATMELKCKRIQFTPDLMPADITGTDILEEDPTTKARRFRFKRGPLFTNLLLADEINRTPPKTQAALLEAMQERRVTVSGVSYELPQPFFVIATQNPIEQEGTYPLPEAQLDRFMFSVKLDFPAADEEKRIIMETTQDSAAQIERILDVETLMKFQHLVRQVPISDHVGSYAIAIARATRPGTPEAPDFVTRWVRWGAGPRAGQYLILAAKAYALIKGRFNVSCADVRRYALPVLRHRIACNFAAASEGVSTDDIVTKILEAIPEPEYKESK